MSLLSYLYRQSWVALLIVTLAGIVSGLSGAALVAVINKGVSGVAPLPTLAWIFFSLCILHLIFKVYSEIYLLRLTQTAIVRLRIELSRQLLATPLKMLQDLGKHKLLVILTKDIESFTQAFLFLPIVFGNIITIAACLGYMAWLSLPLFFPFMVLLFGGLFTYYFAERRPLRQLALLREKMDVIYDNFRNLIEGSRELQLNKQRGDSFIETVITPGALDFKRSFIQSMASYAWLINSGATLFYLGIGVLLFLIPQWIPLHSDTLTGVILILLFLARPISEMMGAMPALREANIALKKIEQLGDEIASDNPEPATADPFDGNSPLLLELQGVFHQYPGDTDDSQFMLGPLDITIRQQEILFIVGGNGSGKTTLAMLLLGFYQPEAGRIILNKTPVTKTNLNHYRQYFSAVFADFHLFEQLLHPDKQELIDRANHYVNALSMAHKVQVVDGKYSTIDLSKGQRKRLALVSSYLEDRQIYLFDEWAADQDPVFKHFFYTELLPDLKASGKTVLVITHDDAYFPLADRIIKLEDGHLKPISLPADITPRASPYII